MTAFAPLISHGLGLLIGYFVLRWRLEISPEQRADMVRIATLFFESVGIWIAIHLGYSWKFNPANTVTPGANKRGLAEKRERESAKQAAKIDQIVGDGYGVQLEQTETDIPTLDKIPAKEKGEL